MKLHSNRIYTPKGPKAGVLTVEGGKITAFAENTTDPEAIEYGDQRIIPGIFDTHNHGTCGYDIMNKNAPHEKQIASVKGYLKGLASQGHREHLPDGVRPGFHPCGGRGGKRG